MSNYDCLIVGSGPAGLGVAFELLRQKPNMKILMLDAAKVSSGGLRNDCKMNFTAPIGFPVEYWSEDITKSYLSRVEQFLNPNILNKNNIDLYQKRADRIGVELLSVRQAHLGTDGGVRLIKELISKLQQQNVEVSLEEEFIEIDKKLKQAITNKRTLLYKHLVIAPGRHGFDFLRKFMKKNEIPYSDNSIDVGVRIETRVERYPIVKDYYDPKFIFQKKTRTFCTNSGAAYVVQEKYTASNGETYYSLNGHSYSEKKKSNGLVNFAMLRRANFTKPLASGQDYAEFLATLAMLIGGGRPLMQRIGDFRLGKRSNVTTINDDYFDFKPSLPSCTPGDITMAMPAKFLNSIWQALKQLDTIIPGILHPSTLLYYPEIKLYANKPFFLNDTFMAAQDIYLIGDGAGTSRGITAAWASGIRAADGIIKECE